MFNKKEAQEYLDKLLKQHKIKVCGYSATSCGRAYIKKREIKIPAPTNIDRFAVCLHEVKHIIDGNNARKFEMEFNCDMFARGILVELGYDIVEWDKKTKWHSLSRIAMAHNRGLNHAAINSDIRKFFSEIDFTKWIGNKVFVGHKYYNTLDPNNIEYTPAMSKNDVELLLNRKGLMLEKSQSDDSTYNRWIVRINGNRFGEDFGNLSEVITRYQLSF